MEKKTENQRLVVQPVRPIFSKITVFSVLLIVRLLSAKFSTIPDCDEVFNYWEPTHYLSHNYGLQTWEYSPVYAIRSWAYAGLHAVASRPLSYLLQLDKVYEFYGLRCIFAICCAMCETRLYSSVSSNISRMIGLLYLVATMTSAGMFHAATSFLPSTLAMYTAMLGTSAFIDRNRGLKTVQGLFWFAIGGFLGWPFSLAMAVPLVLEDLYVGLTDSGLLPTFAAFMNGGLVSLGVLGSIAIIDYWAYGKLEIVPWNIVMYNVFSGSGKGPNIYGTEPWWFYLANLTLNFNILLPLALLSGPLLLLCWAFPISNDPHSTRPMFTSCIPFYLWLTVFTLQPHKEERFMFVAYPALCVSAALAFHLLLTIWGNISNRVSLGRAHSVLNWSMVDVPLGVSAILSISRVLAVLLSYSAPMKVYSALPPTETGNLCIGKEWYRYPSSYFLPDGMRAKFIKNDFDGLLPGEFTEAGTNWDRPGTSVIPEGMNDENKEDMGKYVALSTCDYLIDSYFPPSPGSEPSDTASQSNYILDTTAWEKVSCEKFLDSGKTPTLARTFWVPEVVLPAGMKRQWGEYCLLRRRDRGATIASGGKARGNVEDVG